MVSTVYMFIIHLLTGDTQSLYLNPSPLTYSNANTFCNLHCNSTLAELNSTHYSDINQLIYDKSLYKNGDNNVSWTFGLTLGLDSNSYDGETIDIGQQQFNKYFHESVSHIIRRECKDCYCTDPMCVSPDDNKLIYYKRLTNLTTFDAYSVMKSWVSTNNLLGVDFNLYSSLDDAINNNISNAWTFCNYDDPPGAFRDCGKNGFVPNEWTAPNSGDPSRFSIYTPNINGLWIGNNVNNNEQCLQFDPSNNVTVFDLCDKKKPFICDTCEYNALSKYIIADGMFNYGDGQQFCQSNYGTDLAEINSVSDMNEAKLLCNLFDNSSNDTNCFVSTNYDNNLLNGSNPIYDNGNCAQLSLFNDSNVDCFESSPILCAQPNELCYPSRWQILDGIWTFDDCTVNSSSINPSVSKNMKLDRFADYKWNSITVEYTFLITDLFFSEHRAGIVFNPNNKDGDSIFVGLFLTSGKSRLFMLNQGKSESALIPELGDSYKLNITYTIKFTLNNFGFITIYLNNKMYISLDLNQNKPKWLPLNYYIHFIKIRNDDISTYSKSLYIHGDRGPYIYTDSPTKYPTHEPTINPTQTPTRTTMNPSVLTNVPTINPSKNPTSSPTFDPTAQPTNNPTNIPSFLPTTLPTNVPTFMPSKIPTINPTVNPTVNPTFYPTIHPSLNPTRNPTDNPTANPTINPTLNPTTNPSINPTATPSTTPTTNPSTNPSILPTKYPTHNPTLEPTNNPTTYPTIKPTEYPTINPTLNPTYAYVKQSTTIVDNALVTGNIANLNTLYIILVSVFLMVLCCGLFIAWYMLHRKKRKLKTFRDIAKNMSPISVKSPTVTTPSKGCTIPPTPSGRIIPPTPPTSKMRVNTFATNVCQTEDKPKRHSNFMPRINEIVLKVKRTHSNSIHKLRGGYNYSSEKISTVSDDSKDSKDEIENADDLCVIPLDDMKNTKSHFQAMDTFNNLNVYTPERDVERVANDIYDDLHVIPMDDMTLKNRTSHFKSIDTFSNLNVYIPEKQTVLDDSNLSEAIIPSTSIQRTPSMMNKLVN